jgi:hypothetical protein
MIFSTLTLTHTYPWLNYLGALLLLPLANRNWRSNYCSRTHAHMPLTITAPTRTHHAHAQTYTSRVEGIKLACLSRPDSRKERVILTLVSFVLK